MSLTPIKSARRTDDEIVFRKPTAEDGADIWRLIGECGPLDENSMYCNLLQCDHFADTCVVAERKSDGETVGWVSAYILPDQPDTVFVWQVAVAEAAQGQGLGKRLLAELLNREACADVQQLKTTITSDNDASWALFTSLARRRDAKLLREPYYRRDAHFDGEHATEHMVTLRFEERARSAA